MTAAHRLSRSLTEAIAALAAAAAACIAVVHHADIVSMLQVQLQKQGTVY